MTSREQKEIEVAGFLPARDLGKLSGVLGFPKGALSFVGKCIERLGLFTGLDVGFKLPDTMLGYKPEEWEILAMAEKLKKLGIIDYFHQNDNYHDIPFFFVYSAGTNLKKNEVYQMGSSGVGTSIHSREKAMWAALGEAVERYALFRFDPKYAIDLPYREIKDPGFDINTLAGIDPDVRKVYTKRLLSFDEDSIFRWVPGYSLTKEASVQIPLQLASLKHLPRLHSGQEPYLRINVSTGAATHINEQTAQLTGVLELIERDAFMITWMNKLSPSEIRLDTVENVYVQQAAEDMRRYNLDLHILHLPTDFPVHVVLAIILDQTGSGPFLSLGASARPDINSAIERAVTESLSTHVYGRMLHDNNGGGEDGSTSKNRIITGHKERASYWYNPEKKSQCSFLLKGKKISCRELQDHSYAHSPSLVQMRLLVNEFRKRNMDLISVDLIEKEQQRKLPLRVAMIIAPQLQPLHLDESLPYNWGERLDRVPSLCGFQSLKTKNPVPHPFP